MLSPIIHHTKMLDFIKSDSDFTTKSPQASRWGHCSRGERRGYSPGPCPSTCPAAATSSASPRPQRGGVVRFWMGFLGSYNAGSMLVEISVCCHYVYIDIYYIYIHIVIYIYICMLLYWYILIRVTYIYIYRESSLCT